MPNKTHTPVTVDDLKKLGRDRLQSAKQNVSTSDIATMRKLTEKWPDDIELLPVDNAVGVKDAFYLYAGAVRNGQRDMLVFAMQRDDSTSELIWHTNGPTILTHALQEVMRGTGHSLIMVPTGIGYVAKLLPTEDVFPGKGLWAGLITTSLDTRNPHTNPAIAALRCVAEYLGQPVGQQGDRGFDLLYGALSIRAVNSIRAYFYLEEVRLGTRDSMKPLEITRARILSINLDKIMRQRQVGKKTYIEIRAFQDRCCRLIA